MKFEIGNSDEDKVYLNKYVCIFFYYKKDTFFKMVKKKLKNYDVIVNVIINII